MSTKEELLAAWLDGRLNEQELASLRESYDLEQLESVLRLQKSLDVDTVSGEELWEKIEKGKEVKATMSNRNYLWLLLIFVLAVLVYFFLTGKKTQVDTLKTEEKEVIYADGSRTYLGPNSTLVYNENKWEKERSVNIKGQAVFEVQKGNPFKVATDAGMVTVLGTVFDVWAIDKQWMRVQCLEGRVEVKAKKGDSSEILEAGDQVYILDGSLSEVENFDDVAFDWLKEVRNFKNIPVEIVFKDIERFFDYDFLWKDGKNDDIFSGTISTKNLDEALKFLSTSLGYSYEITGRKILFTNQN